MIIVIQAKRLLSVIPMTNLATICNNEIQAIGLEEYICLRVAKMPLI